MKNVLDDRLRSSHKWTSAYLQSIWYWLDFSVMGLAARQDFRSSRNSVTSSCFRAQVKQKLIEALVCFPSISSSCMWVRGSIAVKSAMRFLQSSWSSKVCFPKVNLFALIRWLAISLVTILTMPISECIQRDRQRSDPGVDWRCNIWFVFYFTLLSQNVTAGGYSRSPFQKQFIESFIHMRLRLFGNKLSSGGSNTIYHNKYF